MSQTHEELEREVIAQYRTMMRGLKATMGQAWMEIDLTLPQMRTLLVLAEEGPLVIGQIAQRLGSGRRGKVEAHATRSRSSNKGSPRL